MTSTVSHGAVIVCIIALCTTVCDGLRNPDNAQERSRARVDRLSRERYGREQERKVIISTVLVDPYMMRKPRPPNSFLVGNDLYEGFIADILHRLSQAGGFPYEIRLSRDWHIGRPAENGSWTGIIGEVMRGEADIGAAPVSATRTRQAAVAFSRPFLDDVRTTAVIRIPNNQDHSQEENEEQEEEEKENGRGIPDERYPLPARYIRSPEELCDSDLLYGVVDGSVVQSLFHRSHEHIYQRMWAQMTRFWPSAFVSSVEEGIQKVRRESYAFLVDSPMADYQATRQPCDMYRTDRFQPARGYSFALRHGAEADRAGRIMSAINAELTRLKEIGELRALYNKWWKNDCIRDARRMATGDETHTETTPVVNPWREATASYINTEESSSHRLRVNVILFCSLLLVVFRTNV